MGLLNEENEDKKERLTIDEVVDRIVDKVSLKLVLIWTIAISSAYVTAAQTFITAFTGFIPYKDWECVSDKCSSLLADSGLAPAEWYNQTSMCGNNLQAGVDFNWTSTRGSFSIDWDIYCETEAKYSVASSFFFIGACVGLAVCTGIFDRLGRKRGALVGAFISSMATVTGTFVPNYGSMLALRVVQGFGSFMSWTGMYCWVVEFAPGRLRNTVSALTLIGWSFGYIVAVVVAYFITDWRYIFLATAILTAITAIPLLIFPESPRFELIRGKEKEAKKTLEKFSLICNNHMSLDSVELVYDDRVQSFLQQVKDFYTFPTMLKETLLCMVSWFLVATLFYAFSFGWSKIGKDMYTSYLFDAVGKAISFVATIPACRWLGRKKAMLFFLVIGILSNFLAMPDVMLSDQWSLEYAACLLGSMAISAAFGTIYLYTGELAPTSHRGMVLSLSSSAARVGSFIGPYIRLLYDIADRRVPLAVFAAATAVMCVAVCFLSDTTGRRIPETPKDVEVLAGKKKYEQVGLETQLDVVE